MNLGTLTVITGPMYSGKTEELIRLIIRARISGLNVAIFKHVFDTRKTGQLATRSIFMPLEATALKDPKQLIELSKDAQVVAIDEVQFFDLSLVDIIKQLILKRKSVIVSGLDMDFKREPFDGCMPHLLCIAEHVMKLKSICNVCKCDDASYSQRLIDGEPAHRDSPLVVIDKDVTVTYEPRCRKCHVID